MNLLELNQLLMQKPPFQMIDKVLTMDAPDYAKGRKNVSNNEYFFAGHFPGFPIMPGVLITECAAQLCSLILSSTDGPFPEGKVPVLLKIDTMKFIRPVIPGDILIIEARNVLSSKEMSKFDVLATVDEEKVAAGTLAFTLMDKSSVYKR